MLTDRFIRSAKAGTYADGGGLYLRVSDKGKKSWLVRTQKNGRNTARVIGTYPQMVLAQARLSTTQAGVETITMTAAVKAYLGKIKVRRPEQVEFLVRPLYDFTLQSSTRELVEFLHRKATKAPVVANRMLTRWKDFFSFCRQCGWVHENPLLEVKRKFVGGKESSRERNLSWDEVVKFLNMPLTPSTKRALYFVLATGLRPSEALWVLRHGKTDAIPTKTTAHKVPLVPHIRALLRLGGHVPASHNTLSNALSRKGVDFTPHDLRRTFATRMADLGVAPHVIEKCLNHRMEGMMAVYNHAEYWEERVEAMRLWGHKLSSLRRKARGQ